MFLDNLRSNFKGDLVIPSEAGYDEAIARWAANAQKKAGAVAFPRDAADVSKAILFAKSQKLDLAIKGGGHHVSGASSTDGGLVIDLSRYLKDVKVDPEQQLAYVGGGALLEAVDKAAIQHGLATVVGIINHTGVGGLVSGGGYGFQSPAHGLAIDCLLQATVVTADGSILIANDKENSDLFWGIRGGGSNFGVITQFVLKLYPQRKTVFAGVLAFPQTSVSQVAAAVEAWWKGNPSEKEVVYHLIGRAPPNGDPFVGLFVFYNGSEEEGRRIYKPFLDLNPVADMCSEIPYESLNSLNNAMAPHGRNRYIKAIFFTGSQTEIIPKMVDNWVTLDKKPGFDYMVFHEYFTDRKVASVPSDATAFFHRQKTCHVLCMATWNENTPENLQYARQSSTELIAHVAKAENTSLQLGYGNYTGEVDASISRLQFGDNYPRLQELKRKYDPDVLFNKWYPITPAA